MAFSKELFLQADHTKSLKHAWKGAKNGGFRHTFSGGSEQLSPSVLLQQLLACFFLFECNDKLQHRPTCSQSLAVYKVKKSMHEEGNGSFQMIDRAKETGAFFCFFFSSNLLKHIFLFIFSPSLYSFFRSNN